MNNETDWVIPVEDKSKPKPKAVKPSPTNELQKILARTAANEVTVKVDQVVELIGEEKANELCIFSTSMAEATRGRVKAGSMIPQSRRTKVSSLGMFNRRDLLDEINKQNPTTTNPSPEKLPKGEPKNYDSKS